MVSHCSKHLRRHSSLLHPSFRRAPREGTAGLRNPASCDPVRERGDQVFGERNRATADGDHFPNDDFFPDLGNLFLDDMGDTGNNSSGSASAAQYVYLSVLYEIFLQFICLAFAVDRICSTVFLALCMIRLSVRFLVMIYLIIFRIKSYAKLLIYSTLDVYILSRYRCI